MSDSPPTAAPPAPRWASLAVRAAGAWILLGCAAKAFFGTPGDLPPLVQNVPLATGTTFALVLAIEAFVGVATLLRPGRAWPLAALLLLAFVAVLTTQVASGAASCGCFGGKIDVPPWVMLAVDAGLFALVLAAMPWRLPRGGRADLVALVAALVVAAAMPLVVRRGDGPGDVYVGKGEVSQWKGMRLVDTPLASWTPIGEGRDGVWLFYKDSCPVCGDCLSAMRAYENGDRRVTLLRIAEKGDPHEIDELLQRPWVHLILLPDSAPITFAPPVRLIVEAGVVTEVTSITDGIEQCRP